MQRDILILSSWLPTVTGVSASRMISYPVNTEDDWIFVLAAPRTLDAGQELVNTEQHLNQQGVRATYVLDLSQPTRDSTAALTEFVLRASQKGVGFDGMTLAASPNRVIVLRAEPEVETFLTLISDQATPASFENLWMQTHLDFHDWHRRHLTTQLWEHEWWAGAPSQLPRHLLVNEPWTVTWMPSCHVPVPAAPNTSGAHFELEPLSLIVNTLPHCDSESWILPADIDTHGLQAATAIAIAVLVLALWPTTTPEQNNHFEHLKQLAHERDLRIMEAALAICREDSLDALLQLGDSAKLTKRLLSAASSSVRSGNGGAQVDLDGDTRSSIAVQLQRTHDFYAKQSRTVSELGKRAVAQAVAVLLLLVADDRDSVDYV